MFTTATVKTEKAERYMKALAITLVEKCLLHMRETKAQLILVLVPA